MVGAVAVADMAAVGAAVDMAAAWADTAAATWVDTVVADFRAVVSAVTPSPNRRASDRTDRECLRMQVIPVHIPVRILARIHIHIGMAAGDGDGAVGGPGMTSPGGPAMATITAMAFPTPEMSTSRMPTPHLTLPIDRRTTGRLSGPMECPCPLTKA